MTTIKVNEPVSNCNALKIEAADGKTRITDAGNVEQIFRLKLYDLRKQSTLNKKKDPKI